MMKKNLQKCLRNWGKPTISNKEIKVIGRFKVRLNMLWRNKCLHRQIIFFNFTLVCSQKIFLKFKGHNSVKNYRIWAIYERMEGWKRATQYAPANLRWEYIKIYNLLHSSFICRVVKILKFLWKSTHKVWWMERLNGEIGWRDRMRDERHIVNTSCPGHIPYMAGNKNQIKLWCLQYIFYK